MSFTAQVKDELSRVEGICPNCAYAQLSAIIRVCGTLSFRGPGRYSIRVSTETGAVARTMIKLTHELFDLETRLTVRHSNLHKVRNYLIEIPEQDEMESDLVRLGILVPGRGLAQGAPVQLLRRRCCRAAFIRGAFMAGGFVADPRGDFHLEIAVTGERFAQDIIELIGEHGITARLNRRRGAYAIYLKSFDDVVKLLRVMGAARSARAIENVRQVKQAINDVNRRVNAETANLSRTTNAAGTQLELIDEAEHLIGLRQLPPAVREFCELRRENPELSLADLGALASPPTKKSGMYHRLLRLRSLVEAAREPS
ncbi:MAG: DNA-binding protein WhiA [Atopobiaceae bacterium]|nr:DNA-binding protein WhiA [Atopobiaceae bacterium]